MSSASLPRITVVTPSFQQVSYLEETLQSVLSQHYPDLEYIVMDGGSTDGSADVIRRYAPHLARWVSESDGGQYDAVQKGFNLGTGEILAWLNSDDLLLPSALRTVGEIMAQFPEVSWISSLPVLSIDAAGRYVSVDSVPGYSRQAFLDGGHLPPAARHPLGWIPQHCTFWRRSLWEKVGRFESQFPLAGDFSLWSQFYRHADLIGISVPLAAFRLHERQRSRRMKQYLLEANDSLACFREAAAWSPAFQRRRDLFLSLRLHRFPLLRRLLRFGYSYSGTRIIRRDPGEPAARWEMEKYQF